MDLDSVLSWQMKHQRSVALLIETSNEYARGLLRGILRYQQEHERWSIDLPEQQRGADPPRWLRRYSGDGIIARIETDAIAKAVQATRLPVVDVSAARYLPSGPWVETDDDKIAELALDHFASRGMSNVAFCCETDFNWARWRRESFIKQARQRGMQVSTFDLGGEATGKNWSRQRPRLMEWLKRLPEPCGLMAAYDSLARRLLDLCSQLEREVPHSIAVLGVDDDPILCRLASPALSSIIPDAEQAGYVASEILEQLMAGKRVSCEARLLAPLGIAIRRSTDTVAVDDPDVECAARYILSNACQGIQVSDVVATTKLTRRALELRFKSALGKTPHELITSTRIARAEQLLRETSLSLEQIARRCGFEYPEYLCRLFRKESGTTPSAYRSTHR